MTVQLFPGEVEELDGSQNEWGWSKAKLGANAILAASMAVCRAGAAAKGQKLYEYIADLAGKPKDKSGATACELCCHQLRCAVLAPLHVGSRRSHHRCGSCEFQFETIS